MEVKFYDIVDDNLLKFAVIIAKSGGKWVFCKHRERNTYEIPGGHREENEAIEDTAKRELAEETGAIDFSIKPVCVYSVLGKNSINRNGEETFGMLYYAEVESLSEELHSEMEKIIFLDEFPANWTTEWTYPLIQPLLIREYLRRKKEGLIK